MSNRTESPPQMPQRYQLQRYKGYLLYGWGVQIRWDGTGWLAQGCIWAMDSNRDEALHWVSSRATKPFATRQEAEQDGLRRCMKWVDQQLMLAQDGTEPTMTVEQRRIGSTN